MKEHNIQNRKVAVIESGSWALSSGKLIRAHLEGMKNMEVLEPLISVLSAIREDQCRDLEALCKAIVGGDAQ